MKYHELTREGQYKAIDELVKITNGLSPEFLIEFALRADFRESGSLANESSIKRDIKHLKVLM